MEEKLHNAEDFEDAPPKGLLSYVEKTRSSIGPLK